MIGMGDNAVLRVDLARVIGARFDVTERPPGRAYDEIAGAGARAFHEGTQRLVETLRVEHFAAAHVEWLPIRMLSVIAGGKTVFNKSDSALVDPHLAAGDPGFGKADEAWRIFAMRAQHEGAAMNGLEPIPVLPQPGMAIGSDRGHQAEGGATVGTDCEQFLPHRLATGQRESKLVAGIEEGNGAFALTGAIGNAAHFFRIRRIHSCNCLAPALRFGNRRLPAEPGSSKPAQIALDVLRNLPAETLAVGKPAGIGVSLHGQHWDVVHGGAR